MLDSGPLPVLPSVDSKEILFIRVMSAGVYPTRN